MGSKPLDIYVFVYNRDKVRFCIQVFLPKKTAMTCNMQILESSVPQQIASRHNPLMF